MHSAFVDIAVKGSIVLAAAYLLSFTLWRASAAARHLLWSVTAAGLLALPVLTLTLPGWEIPLASDALPGASAFLFTMQATGADVAQPSAQTRGGSAPQQQFPPFTRLRWPGWLLLIWAAGVLACLARLAMGAFAVRRLCRRATPLADEQLRELATELGITQKVRVLGSAKATMPLTWGVARPVILLPADAPHWPEERRRLVLAHELAHIKRLDCLTQLLARIAFSLYWFNPLAWLAARQFVKERERACDDLVLSLGARPSDYAAELLEVARSLAAAPNAAWAAVPMARRSQLEGRLLAILDSSLKRGIATRLGLIGTAFAAACFVFPLAAMRPGHGIPPLSPVLARIAPPQIEPDAESFFRQALDAHKEKRFAEAEQLYLRALDIQLKKFGADSLEVARIDDYLGLLAAAQGRTGESERYYLNALVIAEKKPGAEGDVANTLQLCARLLRDTGRIPEAETREARAAEMRKKHLQETLANDQAPSSGPPALRINKSEGVLPPVPLAKGEPGYSDLARLARFQGTAVLYVEIGTDGKVYNVRVLRPLGLGLDEKAVEAVKAWTFQPGTKWGEPVRVAATIEINFRLL